MFINIAPPLSISSRIKNPFELKVNSSKPWSTLFHSSSSNNVNSINNIGHVTDNTNLDPLIGTSYKNLLRSPTTQLRGLINQGNLCFANTIFQSLLFCPPFYNFFNLLAFNQPIDLQNKTPLIEGTIEFLKNFRKLSINELEYGEPFIPNEIYKSLKFYDRFSSFQSGQQQDAEEFLGFFLDTLNEELLKILPSIKQRRQNDLLSWLNELDQYLNKDFDDGWLEVTPKSKSNVNSINAHDSPLTKIFSGKLRSVVKSPGQKDSVTIEPFQPLQLDIEPSNVNSLEDALCNLSKPEVISGVKSSLHKETLIDVTKQITLDQTPPILITHLKRFLYDNIGGVQKSHKSIAFNTILTIPQQILSPMIRSSNPIKYKLFAVIYHHGKSSTSGHYTIDVLSQNLNQWVHIDDISMELINEDQVKVDSYKPNDDDKVAYLLLWSKL